MGEWRQYFGIAGLSDKTNRLINLLAVKWYGESEFWAALGKVILIVALIIFTFITMLGGNPIHDRFGFRYVMQVQPYTLYQLLTSFQGTGENPVLSPNCTTMAVLAAGLASCNVSSSPPSPLQG